MTPTFISLFGPTLSTYAFGLRLGRPATTLSVSPLCPLFYIRISCYLGLLLYDLRLRERRFAQQGRSLYMYTLNLYDQLCLAEPYNGWVYAQESGVTLSKPTLYMYILLYMPSRALLVPRTFLATGPLDLARTLSRENQKLFSIG